MSKIKNSIGLFRLTMSILLVAIVVLSFEILSINAAEFNVSAGNIYALIEAINTANSNGEDDTINLKASVYSIKDIDNDTDGPNGLPSIISNITINGEGKETTIIKRDGTNTQNRYRIFHIHKTGILKIENLTVSGGFLEGQYDDEIQRKSGAGLYNNGDMIITNCIISNNKIFSGDGGGIYNNEEMIIINCIVSNNGADPGRGGAIYNNGYLTVIASRISENDSGFGGSISNFGDMSIAKSMIIENYGQNHAGIYNEGEMNIASSIISGNHGGFGFGGITNRNEMVVTNSTIYANGALQRGGIENSGDMAISGSAIYHNGGDIFGGISSGGNMTITNSTIAKNSGFFSAGIINYGNLSIVNSTIAKNRNNFASDLSDGEVVTGIENQSGTVKLQNTILAGNLTHEGIPANCAKESENEIISLGNNILGDISGCEITPLPSDILVNSAGLGIFVDGGLPGNGHFPLLPNSEAIDAGNNDACPDIDQLNNLRPVDGNGDNTKNCDIGAIEFQKPPSSKTIVSHKTDTHITLDGELHPDERWKDCNFVSFSNTSLSNNRVKVYSLYDETNLYFAYVVDDEHLEATDLKLWKDDGAEIYLDTFHDAADSLNGDDYHFIANINNIISGGNISAQTAKMEPDGYSMEIKIPWAEIGVVPAPNKVMGILLGNNDRDNGSTAQFDWNDLISSGSYNRPNLWGDILLAPQKESDTIVSHKTDTPITLDGKLDPFEKWEDCNFVSFSNTSLSDNRVKVYSLYDETNLYFAYVVDDQHFEATDLKLWKDDGAEIYLDTFHDATESLNGDDYHFIININDKISGGNISSRISQEPYYTDLPGGYRPRYSILPPDSHWWFRYSVEIVIPWAEIGVVPAPNKVMGILLGNNDRDNGSSVQFDWNGLIGTGSYNRPNLWGDILLSPQMTSNNQ